MDLIVTFQTPRAESQRIRLSNNRVEIGREDTADLILDHPSVSRKHARISSIVGKSHFTIEDCGSANGTYLDGLPIESSATFHSDQLVRVGPYTFSICYVPKIPESCPERPVDHDIPDSAEGAIIREAMDSLPHLLDSDFQRTDTSENHFASQVEEYLHAKIVELIPPHADPQSAEYLTKKAFKYAMGLGPLEEWLRDPSIDEIMVNGSECVYLETAGKLTRKESVFPSDQALMTVVERILAPLGRRVDESSPCVDGRLPDGSRINVVIPPVSITGPVLTIRKFPHERLDIEKLVEIGTLTDESSEFLHHAVSAGMNILISGGTGTGKTTLLNTLAAFIPSEERIVTIEDAAELNLNQDHVIRLETRLPNLEGKGAITARDLVINSLRMRPDRIIVGECRGGEAMDMLQAMNTGHEGSMTTCHANSPRDALKRVETMALMADLKVPHRVIREQVASAVQIIVQLTRTRTGSRKVTSIVEVDRLEGEQILTQELFKTDKTDVNETLHSTGLQPAFLQNAKPANFQITDSRRNGR